MRTSRGLSKAYECEDTLQFLDETLASYKQMLNKELAIKRSNRLFPRDKCPDNREKQDGNSSDSNHKETAFKNWLQTVLVNSRSIDNMDAGHYITEGDATFRAREHQFQSFGIWSEYDYTDCCRKIPGKSHASYFRDLSMDTGKDRKSTNCPKMSLSVENNYESSSLSSAHSFNEEGPEVAEDDVFTYPGEEFSVFQYGLGQSEADTCETRTGSWSDSGYCCDKSDSDNSRFSSLSFGDSQKGNDDDSKYSCCSEYLVRIEDRFIDEKAEELTETLHRISLNENLKDVFDAELYTAEELDILQKLLKNPENSHETTKELSDIGRDISRRGWRRRQAKARLTIGQFFRRVIGGMRKFSLEKRNTKLEKANNYAIDLQQNRLRSKTGNRSRSLSPFLKKRLTSSVKTPRKLFSFAKKDDTKIQRASSYSSLFGRRGSLFSQSDKVGKTQCSRRSASVHTLNLQGCDFFYEEAKNNFAGQEGHDCFNSKTDACRTCGYSCDCCEETCNFDPSADWRFRPEDKDSMADQPMVAPLRINISEERSALTRRIAKLRDNA